MSAMSATSATLKEHYYTTFTVENVRFMLNNKMETIKLMFLVSAKRVRLTGSDSYFFMKRYN